MPGMGCSVWIFFSSVLYFSVTVLRSEARRRWYVVMKSYVGENTISSEFMNIEEDVDVLEEGDENATIINTGINMSLNLSRNNSVSSSFDYHTQMQIHYPFN